MLLFGIIMLLI